MFSSNTISALRRREAPLALCAFLAGIFFPVSNILAHESNGHAHEHGHLPVEYELHEGGGGYSSPEPAGGGSYWWKGNLHTHTLWSDGDHFPEIVAQWYLENGYQFLALSDHNVLSRGEKWMNPDTNHYLQRSGGMESVELYLERFGDDWVDVRTVDKDLRERMKSLPRNRRPVEDEMEIGDTLIRLKPLSEFRSLFEMPNRFLLIEAEEITAGHAVHVNATNLVEEIQPVTGETVEETIRRNVEAVHQQSRETGQAILPHLNHPNFQWAVTAEDMAPVDDLLFFEVYNGHRGVRNFGDEIRVDLDRMWDIVLTKRLAELDLGILYGLATDDTHHYEGSSSEVARAGRGWVMVRSQFLTPEHLIEALTNGDFYSSSGVTLESIETTDDRISLAIKQAEGVTYTTQFIGTREGYDPTSEAVFGRRAFGKIADIRDSWVFIQAVADRQSGEQILRVYDEANDTWHHAKVELPAGATNPSGPLYIPSHSNSYPYRGSLENVRFWHRARTRKEAEGDMRKHLSGDEPDLVGYWKLNEVAGTTAHDSAGNYSGRMHGAHFAKGPGIIGEKVLVADGDGHLEVEDPAQLVPGGTSFTIEMWARTDADARGWQLPMEWPGGDRVYVGHDAGAGWNFVVTTAGARTDTQDGESSELVEIRTTRRYSDDIGEVLAEVTGPEAEYRFAGDEIYVRAKVISSKKKENPFAEGEHEKAWTQPVRPGTR